ncbi:uncharacterized protein LOC126369096 [Pectinophora gossypiella]|uniref:uncharacterized protein LOC126369096 n=1 Tax=Pectinophora gossypiella TaxID=13191 RepID=UPI00214EBC0D|nr:uncharacterized protein LOC126369096 [Pectinophora gossypiella]
MAKPLRQSVVPKPVVRIEVDPEECPFREFRDNEMAAEYWGLGPAAFRALSYIPKLSGKGAPDRMTSGLPQVWTDEQTQPLPRSVRHILNGWMRAEELAQSRWDSEVVVFEETHANTMSVIDFQLSHAQVLLRSSFCRRVLSACFILERVENLPVEHQWESFNATYGPEGWRARYHIYSPGMKSGGGVTHRPGISKTGCYMVRLYYLGAWRCVWVSDQVPVDASGAPLLPFSPLSSPAEKGKGKSIPAMVTSSVVHLWPLLICKALLKLAAPDMSCDEEEEEGNEEEGSAEKIVEIVDDEDMFDFDIMHSLTGGLSVFIVQKDKDLLWNLLTSEVQVFSWDDDDDVQSSTAKSKSTKKANPKDRDNISRVSFFTVVIEDTKDLAPFILPGISPAYEMSLYVSSVRDLPIKKPLPEPDVALWKTYRWVDWAKSHGLYEAYECPRTKFMKVNGLMKLSRAPHLLDVVSTESIQSLIKNVNVVFYPSMFEYTSAASNPPIRITKVPMRGIDIPAPKSAPLYLQIDGPEENSLKISLNMLHPRILLNSGYPIVDFIEKAYVFLEVFEWFVDSELPIAKGYIQTRGYDAIEISFKPGRHYCRLWVHSRMNWHVSLLSESTLLLGTRNTIQAAAIHECPWASKFLNALGSAFSNWIRVNRSTTNIVTFDRDFYTSYQPDLTWDPVEVGYEKSFIHWMFRQSLQTFFFKRLLPPEFEMVCRVLRRYFMDPDFGFPPKPKPPKSLREIVARDPCDCTMPEAEELMEEELHENTFQERAPEEQKKIEMDPEMLEALLREPKAPAQSQICELATEEFPCAILKVEREKLIKKHEAATCIQAYWRGTWARKCLTDRVIVTSDVIKLLMDNAFGNLEMLSAVMNEFFHMFPRAKKAYSVASALGGVYGINQHVGTCPVTARCKWVPYFQGVFYCHLPVKVHFDVHSTIPLNTVQIYDNDTGEQLPQSYNAHITFDIHPNVFGYTVMGHGTLSKPYGYATDVHWQLTVMTSIDNVFHSCDNHETELCTVMPLTPASKLHLDEIYIPNRRNILGGVQISVTRVEAVSFRAAATTPDLEIEAILRTTGQEGALEELARCRGKGEIFWPYIRLKPLIAASMMMLKRRSFSTNYLGVHPAKPPPMEPKTYTIEVIAPDGWALPLQQWKRIDEVRNDVGIPKAEAPVKKVTKEKGGSAKDKKEKEDKAKEALSKIPPFTVHVPQAGDAYIELECSTTVGGGAYAKRDDDRDILFATERRNWDLKEPGRNARGARIRKEFRDEFLVPIPQPKSESVFESTVEEEEEPQEEPTQSKVVIMVQQGPTPATESQSVEVEMETEEESLYYLMPEQLRDKFVPLHFVPLCTKEKSEDEGILFTESMAEASKKERHDHIEAALERMRELQAYNERYILGRQKNRCTLLEKLGVDGAWNPDLATVLEERDEAIARETLERSLSLQKKKQDTKKK